MTKILALGLPIGLLLACGGGGEGGTESTGSETAATSPTGSSSVTVEPETSEPTSSGSQTDSEATSEGPSETEATTEPTGMPTTDDPTDATDPSTSEATTDATTEATTTSDTEATTDGGCGQCDEPNQTCIDNECVTSCQGQVPDPCGPDQVCDVNSGECVDPDSSCTVAGDYVECGDATCGPGTVCDGVGECLPVAPCFLPACTSEGLCWGTLCSCERADPCEVDPDIDALNGPFSTEIVDLEFADDCTAWMATLRSGTDYVRRLETNGTVTEWAGVSNLDMGEIKVLKQLIVPAEAAQIAGKKAPDVPAPVEGLGEVAITYICIGGCFVDPPQGVARLIEDDQQNPLPVVIPATTTTGDGPFGHFVIDAGPMGLTWGEDRVLYVGNSTENGELNTADLEAETVDVLANLPERIHAAASVSPVHLLVAIEGGSLYLFNTVTADLEFVVDIGSDVTSLSHDAFSGLVYAGLQSLEIAVVKPFTGEIEMFGMMPGKGRVTVSPNGELYFSPVKYIDPGVIVKWPLPATL